MASLEIVALDPRRPVPAKLWGFALDSPMVGPQTPAYALEISGWVLGRLAAVKEVEIVFGHRVIRRIPLQVDRAEVAERFPDVAEARRSGFGSLVSLVGLPPRFELLVRAFLKDGARPVLATIQGERSPLHTSFQPRLQPLLVTSLGRTGTTWIMRLLAEHPSILAHRAYPYETRIANYWMHAVRVLSEPADHYESAQPIDFWGDTHWIGHNPFYTPHLARQPGLGDALGFTFPERIVAFCQENIEAFYSPLARLQEQPDARYFVEKYHHAGVHLPWLMWEVYPATREIILVRDFRDMVCSMMAFNAKRGFIGFGRQAANSDEEYIRRMRGELEAFRDTWRSRADRVYLLRYEDLIQQPDQTLTALLRYLEVDSSDEVIQGMLQRASVDTTELRGHKTSETSQHSIARWKRDMTPTLQILCWEVFGPLLSEFGYNKD